MSAVVLAPAPAARPVAGGALAGTRGLVRLALRADRFRIVVWALGVAWLMLASAQSYQALFPTAEARQGRATLISSPAATALAGPGYGLDDYTFGAMTANELALWVMIPVAIMAILAATRHLRAPEEDGRLELVRSQPVGRDAPVVAGLVAASVGCAAVCALMFVALLTIDLDPAGTALLSASVLVVGLVFAGASAVMSQLSGTARSASALGMAALGVAFVLRAVGDVRGPQSTSVWTWLSPFGWSQATAPYTLDRWWPLLVGLAATAVEVALAFALVARRDHGTGLLPERLGRAHGRIGGITALTWRRQRTSIVSWAVAIVLTAALIGVLADQVVDFIASEPDMAQLFTTGAEGAAASVFALYVVFLAVMAAAYCGTAVGAARGEETSGRAAPLLASPVSRTRWLGAQVGLAGVVAAATMLVSGLLMGFAAASSLDDPGQVADLFAAGAVTIPGVWLVLGLAAAVLAWAPRALGVVWAYVAYVGVESVFSAVLPDGSDALSPFTYLPALPAEPMDWAAVAGVGAVAVALLVLAWAGFRRRDLAA